MITDMTKHFIIIIIIEVKLSDYRHAGAHGDMKFSSYSFLTSALDGGEWTPLPRFTPGKDPGTHWIGGLVGLRAGLDTEA
jgi:hypothetical protein